MLPLFCVHHSYKIHSIIPHLCLHISCKLIPTILIPTILIPTIFIGIKIISFFNLYVNMILLNIFVCLEYIYMRDYYAISLDYQKHLHHVEMRESMKKNNIRNPILMGTLILTIAGLLTRVIGFFYRIYLSNAMGAENLGIYQMVFPVYGICFTLYASGIQTAISRLVAADLGRKNHKNVSRIMGIGLVLSVSIATLLSIILYTGSNFVASYFMMEERTAPSLRILSYVFPFCGITACINGYYYGNKSAKIPGFSQLLEQLVRVTGVYLLANFVGGGDGTVSCELAVFGVVIGEIASSLYNCSSLLYSKSKKETPDKEFTQKKSSGKKIFRDIVHLSIPLTGNHLFLSILHSIEAVLIPAMLRKSGLSTSEALSLYGIFTGMSMPFITFPTAITNALAVLLLPTIAEAQARKDEYLIGKTTAVTIKYCMLIGILATALFVCFGNTLGSSIFHNQASGYYLTVLAWLCPFLYLTTTLGSIINGLGKAYVSFFNNTVGQSIRIILILLVVPVTGIYGYLIALLISQLINTVLDCSTIIRNIKFQFDAVNTLLKPGITVALLGAIFSPVFQYVLKLSQVSDVLLCLAFCFLFSICFIALLVITKTVRKHDFK